MEPDRDSGTIWYFWAVSAGTSWIDLEFSERDGRNAVLTAEERGHLVVFHEPELDQVQAELSPVLALVVERLLELFRRDALLLEKQLSDAYGH